MSRRVNDQRIVGHSPICLREWRANTDFSILFNLTKVMLYVTKYATKSETKSSLFNTAAYEVFSDDNSKELSNKTCLRKIFCRVLAQRDVAVPEAIHMLMGWPLHCSNITVATVNLVSSRQLVQNAGRKVVIRDSLVDLYAKRKQEHKELNFQEFAMEFDCVQGELKERRTDKSRLVLRFFQKYSSNPNGANYSKFCKFSLLRYKPWHTTHSTALATTDSNGVALLDDDEGWIKSWKQFIVSAAGKRAVPDSYHRTVEVHRRIESGDIEAELEEMDQEEYESDGDEGETQADWQENMNPRGKRGIGPDNNDAVDNGQYWQADRALFDREVILSMPMWMKTQKELLGEEQEEYDHVDVSKLNENQLLAYNILKDHFENTPNEQLLLRLEGQGGII